MTVTDAVGDRGGEETSPDGAYRLRGGIYRPSGGVVHRDDEYESLGFDILLRMQTDHFWYRGRHRFLLNAVKRRLGAVPPRGPERLIDLGGGCGGWVAYLARQSRFRDAKLALADSSERALEHSASVVPGRASRYQVDLMNLRFSECWDVAFLLDVLEHIPDHEAVIRQVMASLVPGGLLFVTVPALQSFWTWNDDAVKHQRRYSRGDFRRLAETTGCELVDARYFMFFLSPLVLASRWLSRTPATPEMPDEEKARLLAKTHAVPSGVINAALSGIFACETPVGHYLRFPWGTSLLAVIRKPPAS